MQQQIFANTFLGKNKLFVGFKNARRCIMPCNVRKQQAKLMGRKPEALQPTPLTRDRALAVQPKLGEREESYYGSSRSMLIFSTPLTRGACSGETKLEGVRVTHWSTSSVPLEQMIRVVGMVATPSRTQSITPNMNKRIAQPYSRNFRKKKVVVLDCRETP